jgi:galactokinase
VTLPLQTDPPIRLLAAFQDSYPSANPDLIMQAPGREMWVIASFNVSNQYSIAAPDMGGCTTFSHQSAKNKRTVMNRPLPSWARYSAGVIVALGNAGLYVSGVEAAIAGEEPSGPRYEYALGITVAALWHHLNELPYTTASLIEIIDRVRREYVEI